MVIHLLHSPKGWYRANEQLDLTMVGAKFNKRNEGQRSGLCIIMYHRRYTCRKESEDMKRTRINTKRLFYYSASVLASSGTAIKYTAYLANIQTLLF